MCRFCRGRPFTDVRSPQRRVRCSARTGRKRRQDIERGTQLPRDLLAAHGITFDVVTDPGCRVARAYGVAYDFPGYLRRIYETPFDCPVGTYNGEDC